MGDVVGNVVAEATGPVLVLGAAGTGKTTLLAEAVASRVRDGLAPALVLALTRQAASELRDRVVRAAGRTTLAPRVMTIHAFCLGLVTRYRDPEDEVPALLTAPQQEYRIRELLEMCIRDRMYVADALNANPDIAGAIVSAFASRFDPGVEGSEQHRAEGFETELAEILQALDAVESLDQDRILRMFVAVLRAIVRTNAFAEDRPALAFKLLPTELDLLPEPRPAYEIFVYSPRVQGVHLRFGAVARGGLRWSDRKEDFRTEILGLVKAQMVKNTVIVPVGAKGGFVPANLPDPRADRAGWLAEGVACYEIFISSLLSLTDNLVDGAVVPPPDVLRYDGDDT